MGDIVTLTTDFGIGDQTAAVMKGVMLSIRPELTIVDVTHTIPPRHIQHAAYTISRFRDYFPEGTVHVVVVDPGVGSKREGIIIQTKRYFYIGPNNGVFTMLDSDIERVVKIENPKYLGQRVSATFHGRDVFAPVAAHLTRTAIGKFGPDIDQVVKLHLPEPVMDTEGGVVGEVIGFDNFGNAITNIANEQIEEMGEEKPGGAIDIRLGKHKMNSLIDYYQTGPKESLGAIINSLDYLELFTPNGNAQKSFNIKKGDRVVVRFRF